MGAPKTNLQLPSEKASPKAFLLAQASVYDKFQLGGVPGDLGASDKDSLAADNDLAKDIGPEDLKVISSLIHMIRSAQQPIVGGPGCWDIQ